MWCNILFKRTKKNWPKLKKLSKNLCGRCSAEFDVKFVLKRDFLEIFRSFQNRQELKEYWKNIRILKNIKNFAKLLEFSRNCWIFSLFLSTFSHIWIGQNYHNQPSGVFFEYLEIWSFLEISVEFRKKNQIFKNIRNNQEVLENLRNFLNFRNLRFEDESQLLCFCNNHDIII
jgi:hypothetical protein